MSWGNPTTGRKGSHSSTSRANSSKLASLCQERQSREAKLSECLINPSWISKDPRSTKSSNKTHTEEMEQEVLSLTEAVCTGQQEDPPVANSATPEWPHPSDEQPPYEQSQRASNHAKKSPVSTPQTDWRSSREMGRTGLPKNTIPLNCKLNRSRQRNSIPLLFVCCSLLLFLTRSFNNASKSTSSEHELCRRVPSHPGAKLLATPAAPGSLEHSQL